eukprot:8177320-Pyramimonas_sp.AAC.1
MGPLGAVVAPSAIFGSCGTFLEQKGTSRRARKSCLGWPYWAPRGPSYFSGQGKNLKEFFVPHIQSG